MAQYLINDTTLTALGDKVREKTGETAQLSLDNVINTEVDKVFDAGKKSEYDAFWDKYQNNGNRTHYAFGFAGSGWTTATFKPKYNLIVSPTARYMFAGSLYNADIAEILANHNIILDTSGVSSADGFSHFCDYSGPSRFPTINTTGCANINSMFYYSPMLHSVDKLILKDDGTQTFTNAFIGCSGLENLIIEGTIGQNGFNVQWSTNLTHDSLMSIINALQDKTGDTSGTIWTVTLGADNIAKLTDEEQQIARDKGWVIE